MPVGIALRAGDALVAPAFPFTDWVAAIPQLVEPPVLAGQAELVTLAHVQVGAGNSAATAFGRHRRTLLEIHHHWACAVLPRPGGKHAETEIAAVAVDLADHRNQVVQVRLGSAEYRVVGSAMLASALLPAAPLMANHPGGDDVLPFHTSGALWLFARYIAAAGQVDAIAAVAAAAVEIHRALGVDSPG